MAHMSYCQCLAYLRHADSGHRSPSRSFSIAAHIDPSKEHMSVQYMGKIDGSSYTPPRLIYPSSPYRRIRYRVAKMVVFVGIP